MCKICPQCGAIAEYNAYYGRTTCTRCNWESEKDKPLRMSKIMYKTKPKRDELALAKRVATV